MRPGRTPRAPGLARAARAARATLVGLVGLGALFTQGTVHAQSLVPGKPSTQFEAARFSTVEGAGGVPLNVVDIGEPTKPGVLLIHGYRQSYVSWYRQFKSPLAARCRLVAFDLRGHGNSGQPWQPEAYDNAQVWADDVARVMAATGLRRPLLVGWSFGANVALDYLRVHGEQGAAGLMIVASGASMAQPQRPPGFEAILKTILSPDAELNLATRLGAAERVYQSEVVGPEMMAKLAAISMRASPFVDRGGIRRVEHTNRDLAARLTLPVTLVLGGRDPIVPAPAAELIKQSFPKARVVTFDKAGHAPFIEAEAEFNALLEEHCGKP